MVTKYVNIFFTATVLSLWWLIIQLIPFRWQLKIGDAIGALLYGTNSSRKKIAKVNIDKCFPHLSSSDKDQLLRSNLNSTAKGLFETGAGWFWSNRQIMRKCEVKGLENLKKARSKNGGGVLFLGFHFIPLEIGAAVMGIEDSIDGFYRPNKNELYEKVQRWGRGRRNEESENIPNGSLRGIIKSLKRGRTVFYAPDQDHGLKRSLFAPFFGIETATVKSVASIAEMGNAQIVPWACRRSSEEGRYIIEIYPSISEQLGKGNIEDAARVNKFIEERILEYPEQYLWVHRRFKTRPEGEQSFYEPRVRKRKKNR